jgi:uncharacterized membrane protein
MSKIKEIILIIAIISLGTLFGGGLYESVVNAPNFRAGLPNSVEHFRQFMSVANPGSFFRVVAPLTQISLLVSLILNWKKPPRRRWWLLAALILVVTADAITFGYVYPRNDILFSNPLQISLELLEKTAAEWMYANYIRVVLTVTSLVFTIRSLLVSRHLQED